MQISTRSLSGWVLEHPKPLPEIWAGDWDIQTAPEPLNPDTFALPNQRVRFADALRFKEQGTVPRHWWRKRLKRRLRGASAETIHQHSERHFRQLWRSLRNGFVRQEPGENVRVAVGRAGHLYAVDGGTHRLALCWAFDMPIHVDVVARHPRWLKFRNRLASGKLSHGPPFYTHFIHPDLEGLPCAYDLGRFDVVMEHINPDASTALDLGCRYNTYGHLLEDKGLDCTGIDCDEREFALARVVHNSMLRRGRLILGDILDHPWDQDVVIALNVLKYVCEDPRFEEHLRTSKFKQMFFAADHKRHRMRKLGGQEGFAQTVAEMAGRTATYLGNTVYLIS